MLDKVESVTNYVTEHKVCRSAVIQIYFDEQDVANCGVCDSCLKRQKEQTAPEESQIINLLKAQPMDIIAIQKTLKKYPPEEVENTVRVLLDLGEIKKEDTLFVLKK